MSCTSWLQSNDNKLTKVCVSYCMCVCFHLFERFSLFKRHIFNPFGWIYWSNFSPTTFFSYSVAVVAAVATFELINCYVERWKVVGFVCVCAFFLHIRFFSVLLRRLYWCNISTFNDKMFLVLFFFRCTISPLWFLAFVWRKREIIRYVSGAPTITTNCCRYNRVCISIGFDVDKPIYTHLSIWDRCYIVSISIVLHFKLENVIGEKMQTHRCRCSDLKQTPISNRIG